MAFARARSSPRPRRRSSTLIPSVACRSFVALRTHIHAPQTWSEIGRRLRRVLPFLWPSRSPKLLLLVFVCTILVAAGRFINVGIPFSLGKTVANLETYGRPDPTARLSPWPPLLIYVALRFSSSAVTTIVEVLWQVCCVCSRSVID